jgi:hypothetical protein
LAQGDRSPQDLEGYLTDGRFEIDHHLIENAIRPTKPRQKNRLVVGKGESGP